MTEKHRPLTPQVERSQRKMKHDRGVPLHTRTCRALSSRSPTPQTPQQDLPIRVGMHFPPPLRRIHPPRSSRRPPRLLHAAPDGRAPTIVVLVWGRKHQGDVSMRRRTVSGPDLHQPGVRIWSGRRFQLQISIITSHVRVKIIPFHSGPLLRPSPLPSRTGKVVQTSKLS